MVYVKCYSNKLINSETSGIRLFAQAGRIAKITHDRNQNWYSGRYSWHFSPTSPKSFGQFDYRSTWRWLCDHAFHPELINELLVQQGVFVAVQGDRVIAYALAGSWDFFGRWPIFPHMVSLMPSWQFQVRQAP